MATPQQVLLTVPAQPEFLRVARVTASGLASRLGFSIDEVDDLRLALDELCFGLIGSGSPDAELSLCYRMEEGSLTIEGETDHAGDQDALSLGDLSKQILAALVDDHRIWNENGSGHFSLTKRQASHI